MPILSKKVFIALIAGILVLGGAYVLDRNPGGSYGGGDSQEAVTIRGLIERDSDKDGVKDWEEALWNTDPKNPATFGMPDADYVAKRRAEGKSSDPGAGAATTEKLNETDALARQLFAAALSLKESGQLTNENLDSLSKTVLSGAIKGSEEPPYAEKNLTIVPVTPERASAYALAMKALSKNYQALALGTEIEIIAEALDSKDPARFAALAPFASLYGKLGKEMAALSVPSDIAAVHLSLVNRYLRLAAALGDLGGTLENPMAGFAGLLSYAKERDGLVEDSRTLNAYVNGVILLDKK